ncbi:alpha/beta fold hydrolase [Culicoidibacter larvae]|uniref:Alpha/beta hydrolase n=1 Tax=Culicoidibacter larvae TaxID=2579976 RepID=A0A5R8Q913_9FIRM|nr:alpha/beta hydrolase [Culicoidibacter larvae]TLG71108.1 alpha/beta hydrolase [Culicoidibacter larvae]
MQVEINGAVVNYSVAGEGADIILLHGWGQNIAMMDPVGDFLKQWFRVWILDFPGFGESSEPPVAWSVYDYADMLHEFRVQHGIERAVLMGHSFGGRIAIIEAARFPLEIEKVVLFDAAGVKPKRGVDYYAKVYTYKVGKRVLGLPGLKKLQQKVVSRSGSSDYQQASDVMKHTLSLVVNEDLQYLMPKMTMPVLLIWGAEDDATPVSDAKKMEAQMPNAGLVVYEQAGHYAYLECLPNVLRVLDSFLTPNK